MVREFNIVRTSPEKYSEKIISFLPCLKYNLNNNKPYFDIPNITKINLIKGKEGFDICIDQFKRMKNLEPLELKSELSFPFPHNNTNLCNDKDYITNNFLEMNKKLKDLFYIRGFHYDININNPEYSTLMQIIDDNNSNGQRRFQILDKDIKYVGISSGRIKKNLYCIYVVFAS